MIEWRRVPISPYRAYEVSNDGRVRRGAKMLRTPPDRYGYSRVGLYFAGLRRHFKLHRLICEAFHGPCPPQYECAHLDSDKQNNRPENLAWVTRSENQQHNIERGVRRHRASPGELHHAAKLTADQVDQIRAAVASGSPQRAVARQFGISQTQVCHIASGKKWAAGNRTRKAA